MGPSVRVICLPGSSRGQCILIVVKFYLFPSCSDSDVKMW